MIRRRIRLRMIVIMIVTVIRIAEMLLLAAGAYRGGRGFYCLQGMQSHGKRHI